MKFTYSTIAVNDRKRRLIDMDRETLMDVIHSAADCPEDSLPFLVEALYDAERRLHQLESRFTILKGDIENFRDYPDSVLLRAIVQDMEKSLKSDMLAGAFESDGAKNEKKPESNGENTGDEERYADAIF